MDGIWLAPPMLQGFIELRHLLEKVKPEIVICVGNFPLWLLTGEWGVSIWRGSQLTSTLLPEKCQVIPTFSPTLVNRDMSLLPMVQRDFRRVASVLSGGALKPIRNLVVRPTYEQAVNWLTNIWDKLQSGKQVWLAGDFETRAGHIACLGIASSRTEAICLPFMCQERGEGYWELSQETQLVLMVRQIFLHPLCRSIFHNGLYDCQYFQRHWGYVPNMAIDTMVTWHSCFSGMKKSLGFVASMQTDYYVYWKDDGKTWEESMDEDKLWTYCCLDVVNTFEIAYNCVEIAHNLKLLEPVTKTQHGTVWLALYAMVKGFRVNQKMKGELSLEMRNGISERQTWLNEVTGQELNTASPKQMCTFFYTDMGQRAVLNRKSKTPGGVTADDDALKVIASREPLLKPLTDVIAQMRSLATLVSTHVEARLDIDGRMRTSYAVAGPETFRFSSGTSAFWNGVNIQNVTKGDEDPDSKFPLPNLRKMYIPDEGMEFFDMDLDRADLQVVVWEAEDDELKRLLRLGVDLHIVNGLGVFGKSIPPLEELIETHPNYPEHRGRAKKERQFAKNFIHGTNYGGGAPTMAKTVGVSVRDSDAYQKRWFSMHPGIKVWHQRTQKQLETQRFVENKFGYRRYYFDRVDGLLPEALAWVPQSTVGLVINRVWERIWNEVPEIQVIIQVHDSLGGQFRIDRRDYCIQQLKERTQIVIPYDDPLIIPTGLKTSQISWGHCE